MTKAEILKQEILKQYKSVRQFALEMEIPYSTLVTALDRGIEGMAYGTVIRMCDKLSLNPVDFSTLEKGEVLGEKILENRVMQYYIQLNKKGRKRILEMMEDYVQLDKYRELGRDAEYEEVGDAYDRFADYAFDHIDELREILSSYITEMTERHLL